MKYVTGKIYRDGSFEEGYLGFEEGIIKEAGKGQIREAVAKGIIIPGLVNAHTHIGDAVIREEVKGGIKELVAPPFGLKHRVLRETPRKTLVDTMKYVAERMLRSGIEHFCDFREGGMQGVELLRDALHGSPLRPKVFGRPEKMKYDHDEMEQLLASVDGIGLSSISDWEVDEIKKVSEHTKKMGCCFALHASERVREDIEAVLDLSPDFLIHMNEASDEDLKLCADNKVPIIVCPRSEVFFGNVPDIPRMLKKGLTLALGTDNAMLNTPHSILREMEFAYKISRLKGDVDAKDILDMALRNPRKVLNAGDDICLALGKEANFVVFDLPTKHPAHALVNGAGLQDISLISIDNYLWLRGKKPLIRRNESESI